MYALSKGKIVITEALLTSSNNSDECSKYNEYKDALLYFNSMSALLKMIEFLLENQIERKKIQQKVANYMAVQHTFSKTYLSTKSPETRLDKFANTIESTLNQYLKSLNRHHLWITRKTGRNKRAMEKPNQAMLWAITEV